MARSTFVLLLALASLVVLLISSEISAGEQCPESAAAAAGVLSHECPESAAAAPGSPQLDLDQAVDKVHEHGFRGGKAHLNGKGHGKGKGHHKGKGHGKGKGHHKGKGHGKGKGHHEKDLGNTEAANY